MDGRGSGWWVTCALVLATGCGDPGGLTVAPGQVDFGAMSSGSMALQTVRIRNDGPEVVTLGNLSVETTSPGGGLDGTFELVDPPQGPVELRPGRAVDLTVAFTAHGTRVATGRLAWSADPVTLAGDVVIEGRGAGPSVLVEPEVLVFGVLEMGWTTEKTVVVTNAGVGPATVHASIVDSDAFSLSAEDETFVLAEGAERELAIVFEPDRAGLEQAVLRIETDVDPEPQDVVLHGPAAPDPNCRVEVRPPTLSFGGVPIGYTRARTVYVTNVGEGSDCLVWDAALDSEAGAAVGLSLIEAPEGLISPGESAALTVAVEPRAPMETWTGTLSFRTSDPDHLEVGVPVEGSAAYARVVISPRDFDFGAAEVGQVREQDVCLYNTGLVEQVVSSWTWRDGSGAVAFSNAPDPTGSVVPGGDRICTMIAFAPPETGLFTARYDVVVEVDGVLAGSAVGVVSGKGVPGQ